MVSNKNRSKSKQITVSSVLIIIVIALWNAFMGDGTDTTANQPVIDDTEVVVENDSSGSSSESSDAALAPTTPKKKPTKVPAAGGKFAADSGFLVDKDGFSFENYGNDTGVSNLKANDMQRLFGDDVCTRIKDGKCTLTSPARQWMKEINEAMDGGHCEGMAVASLHMFHKIEDPNTFGAATTNELPFDGNTSLQQEIAYWWATQSTEPTMSNMITGKPSDILKLLSASLGQGQNANVFYTIGIYMADGSGGHAVTPVSITDLGNGKTGLNIYDNNWPNELRTIEVDLKEETWSYQASINPDEESSLYTGDQLEITPSAPRLQPQECDFCGGKNGLKSTKTFIVSTVGDVVADRDVKGSTYFETPDGKRIGYIDGELINEIEGASVRVFKSAPTLWDEKGQPIFRIPDGISVTLKMNNDPQYQYSVSAFDNGKVVAIDKLALSATKKSEIYFGNTIKSLKIKSAVKTSPDIFVGDEKNANLKGSATQISNVDISEDGEFDVFFDEETDQFSLDGDVDGDFDLDVIISDEEGDYAYSADDIGIESEVDVAFDIDAIDSEDDSMDFQYDYNDDGEFETQTDVQDNNTSVESDSAAYNDLTDY
ncbi:MAG: hypothetical protein DWI30_04325 [Chloroflexi bacterium]|nr:MAG: hypothetical protein DWI30_04325 [Chloroflexota bacterium]